LVEVIDCLFELRIGKGLGSQLEQDFLLGFQDSLSGTCNAFNGFEGGIITAGVHIDLYQIVTYFIGIYGVGKLIQEMLKDCH